MAEKILNCVAISGTDGSGKYTTSTYLAKIIEQLSGKLTEVVSFPQHGTVQGELVDHFLYKGLRFNGEEFQKAVREGLLYSIDRMVTMTKIQENGKTLADEIRNGEKFVIFDRYLESNFVHRCKTMSDDSLESYIELMEIVEFEMMGIPKPDITFMLKVDPEISYQNIINRGREMDENESLENIKASYEKIDKLCKMQGYIVIDCCKTVQPLPHEPEYRTMKKTEEIVDEILKHIPLNNIKNDK